MKKELDQDQQKLNEANQLNDLVQKGNEEQSNSESSKNIPFDFKKIAIIGFFGGIYWSFIAYVAAIFDFTQIRPNFILGRLSLGDWINGVWGQLLCIVIFGIVSILFSFIYYFIGRKWMGIWPGIFYGFLIWILLFVLLGQSVFDLKPIKDYSSDTLVTSICFYVLYGTFITYSVSFNFHEESSYLRGYSK
jgi:hypothetical protein